MAFRILLVDDSALVREAVKDILGKIKEVEVCGEARNGREAINQTILQRPDLVIMDVEMPEMDGLTALREMRERGIAEPVIMLSVLTQRGANVSLQALGLGALDFVPKPSYDSGLNLYDVEELLLTKIKEIIQTKRDSNRPFQMVIKRSNLEKKKRDYRLFIIGSSTGGPRALQEIFKQIPANFNIPIIIVQHMPPVFTATFAERLDQITSLRVVEARNGEKILSGSAYVTPGDNHLQIEKNQNGPIIHLNQEKRVNGHRPSIDVTIMSGVEIYGREIAAMLMTGMGRDGVLGMKKLYDSGGLTLAQNEESSVVFGMNRRAIELGVVDRIIAIDSFGSVIKEFFGGESN